MACRLFGTNPLSRLILTTGASARNFSEIWIIMRRFLFKKMLLKCRPKNGGHVASASMCSATTVSFQNQQKFWDMNNPWTDSGVSDQCDNILWLYFVRPNCCGPKRLWAKRHRLLDNNQRCRYSYVAKIKWCPRWHDVWHTQKLPTRQRYFS